MVLLAWFKYLIAYKVDSRALRTDGKVANNHGLLNYTAAWTQVVLKQKSTINSNMMCLKTFYFVHSLSSALGYKSYKS